MGFATTRSRVAYRVLFAAALVLAMCMSALAPQAALAEKPAEGESGNCIWTIDESGKLTVAPKSGTDGVLASFGDGSEVPWKDHIADIESVIFESGVKAGDSMACAFKGCGNMTTANLAGLTVTEDTCLSSMFDTCWRLQTIYASDTWIPPSAEKSENMFSSCSGALKGGDGTEWKIDHTNGEYARIDDKPDHPGYFTSSAYTVSFDGNDDDGKLTVSGQMDPQTLSRGVSEALAKNAFEVSGGVFLGWNTEPDGSGDAYSDAEPVDSITTGDELTLYAQWGFPLTLKKTSGVDSVSGGGTFPYKSNCNISATLDSGYDWAGWTGTESISYQNATIQMTGPKSFTANTSLHTYTIEYDLGGGKLSLSNPTSYTFKSSSINLNPPTKSGYAFAGWTGTGLSNPAKAVYIPSGSTGNRRYKALWTTQKITFTPMSIPSSGIAVGKSAEVSGSTYKATSATEVTLTKAKDAKSVTVPATVKIKGKTYEVTKIAANAFTGSKIRSVTLGSKITTIPKNAFNKSKATSVNTGSAVTTIYANAFTGSSVTKLTVGKNVKKIYSKAFNTSKVSTLVVKTKKLKNASSVKGAFWGAISAKVTVIYGSVGKKYVSASFTKKNLEAKKVVLKK